MMRNRLLIAAAALMMGGASLQAQCTPDPFVVLLGLPGVYPNPVQQSNLASGSLGMAYSDRITIVTPADTTLDLSGLTGGIPIPPVTVSVDYQSVTGITGLPAGVTYACNVTNCEVPGDSAGCVALSGTPTQAGTFTVTMSSQLGFTVPASVPVIGGSQQSIPIPGLSWTIEIAGGVGMPGMEERGFSLASNSPNPFTGTTTVRYEAARPAAMTLQVRDLTGRIVGSASQQARTGDNAITFDGSHLSPGVYLYTLSNGQHSATRKMVVGE